jgi:Rieske Fe-S protein
MDAQLSRREALASTLLATAAGTALCSGLGACGSMSHEKKNLITTGSVDIGPAANYPAGSVSATYLDRYGIVIVNESGTPIAIRPKCTHMGCIAKWNPTDTEFQCPCHGSRFDTLGRPTKGPAKKPLPALAATPTPANTLMVDLDKLYAL